ncbi:MAG: response regulator [Opitutaceae bacterium]|nr:response regulator [Opitutaceae bacterium]
MSADASAKPTVLLLEDDTAAAEMAMRSLGDDFDIERAANVEEAKMLLASRPFDVLLCDHMMPGKQQGLDFLVEAMQHYPRSKRILMTGYINPDLISRSTALAGLSACLTKPVNMSEVKRVLRQTLGLNN